MKPKRSTLLKKDAFSVKGKVIIITGGIGYLGMQYAHALGNADATVVVWDVASPERLAAAQQQFDRKKITVSVAAVNITDEAAVQAAVKQILKKYSRIDGLINNAAMNPAFESADAEKQFVPYEDYPIELWEKELKVNLTGTLICTKAVAPHMMQRKSGSIVNVASDLSVLAHNQRIYNDPKNKRFKSIAYTTTKTALVGFSRQWAARLGEYGVRVNTFSPTGVQNKNVSLDFAQRFGAVNMLGRMAQEGEYGAAVIFLCSDASSMMTGHNLVMDGGRSAW